MIDLTSLNLANATTHLSADSVSRGVAHAILFKPTGAQGGSLGIVTDLTPVRDDTTEDFKVPATFEGGPKYTLFSNTTETKRGETFSTITRDAFTLGLFYGAGRTVAAGEFQGAQVYDNGGDGTTSGAMLRVTTNGVGRRATIVVRPGGTLKGTSEGNEDTAPTLNFEYNGNPAGVTWTVPAALEGNATVYSWGAAVIVDYADLQAAVALLWASLPA